MLPRFFDFRFARIRRHDAGVVPYEVLGADKMILHIASGSSVAGSLKYNGIKNIYSFNEAMCEGETVSDIFSPEFTALREKAYDLKPGEYTPFYVTLKSLLNAERLELYFDYDMFCAVNTITLLSYLEKVDYKGLINFNLIEHDGTADIIKSFPIELGLFSEAYNQVLVNRKFFKTNIKHIDNGINLCLKYKSEDNEIIRYIKENNSLQRTELCVKIINNFPEYGIGDTAIFKMIDKVRAKQ